MGSSRRTGLAKFIWYGNKWVQRKTVGCQTDEGRCGQKVIFKIGHRWAHSTSENSAQSRAQSNCKSSARSNGESSAQISCGFSAWFTIGFKVYNPKDVDRELTGIFF